MMRRQADMQALPLVSVVMPSFNQAQFIDASIASVLQQSYPRLELIVADGGSNDGTLERLSAWQRRDARLRFASAPDAGPADALNKALAQVRGTLVGWLNSDDLYTPGAVQRAVERLCDGSGRVLVYGHGQHIDASGERLNDYPTRPWPQPLTAFAAGCFICQPSVFFTRSASLLLGPLDTSLQTAFDFDYWLRAFRAFPERIAFVDAVQAQSRLHQACITQKMRRTVALEGMRLLAQHLGRAPLHWAQTHIQEAVDTQQPDLQRYLQDFLNEAAVYFSKAECQLLQKEATAAWQRQACA